MEVRIETIGDKKLLGTHMRMSLEGDKTMQLWQIFMPKRKAIKNSIGNELFSVTIYDQPDFKNFNHDTEFEKWASIEVLDFDDAPEGLEPYNLVGGLYAVFVYKGAANAFGDTMYNIITGWLPQSGYKLDARAHFFVMGEKYKGNDPSSEEEYWMPVKE